MNEDVAISVTDLFKSFDGGIEFVLKGLSVKVKKGSLTSIIGYSGTGKSVLLKHFLGLLRPSSGVVQVLGQDIWQMSETELNGLRSRLGVLFQHAALFDDMTVLENVTFPLREHRRDLGPAEVVDIAVRKLRASGLDDKHFRKLPEELSGGMRKRCGLARALALDPDIILYDEPTTGLDPILTEMVDDLILTTHKSRAGTTSIMVSHDLSAAFRLADHVVMLDRGNVLLEGTREEFFNSEIDLVKRFVEKGLRRDSK